MNKDSCRYGFYVTQYYLDFCEQIAPLIEAYNYPISLWNSLHKRGLFPLKSMENLFLKL